MAEFRDSVRDSGTYYALGPDQLTKHIHSVAKRWKFRLF